MSHPLISIVVPFKNTAGYLPDCLNSVLSQSYPYWEMLLADDGSTDESHAVVKSYADKDQRIRLFQNEGVGIINALRTAYNNSTGALITRMDSDDIMTPDKLEIMSKALINHGPGHVALGLVKYFSEQGISDGYSKYETWINGLTKTGGNYTEIYKECVIPSPSWMIHREDLDRAGAFNSDIYPEDYDLTFRFYEHEYTCIPSDKVLHLWRDYGDRTSRTDERYSMERMLDIKLIYFLKLDYNKTRPLTIWGAGKKGKRIARTLLKDHIPFFWICDNPKKIGRDIYGKTLLPFEYLKELDNSQSIITVANANDQAEIRNYLESAKLRSMTDYFFFC